MSITDLSSDRTASHRSLQVIAEVKCVVRELVENAIDAGANDIGVFSPFVSTMAAVVKLIDNGTTAIRVVDNGHGIKESNFEQLADEDMGWELKFKPDGTLQEKNRVATKVGTTVTCRNLFEPYPVRRNLLLKAAKSHLSGTVGIVQQYALIHPEIRFAVSNVSSSSYQLQSLFTSPGNCKTIREVSEQIFGSNFVKNVVDVSLSGDGWSVEGVISTPQTGRQSKDIQILFVNRRPVDEMKKIKRCLKDVHRQFSSKNNVAYILNLAIDCHQVDVNLAPDKRRLFLMQEEIITQQLKQRMVELYMMKMAKGSLTNDPLSLKQMQFSVSGDLEHDGKTVSHGARAESVGRDRSVYEATQSAPSNDESTADVISSQGKNQLAAQDEVASQTQLGLSTGISQQTSAKLTLVKADVYVDGNASESVNPTIKARETVRTGESNSAKHSPALRPKSVRARDTESHQQLLDSFIMQPNNKTKPSTPHVSTDEYESEPRHDYNDATSVNSYDAQNTAAKASVQSNMPLPSEGSTVGTQSSQIEMHLDTSNDCTVNQSSGIARGDIGVSQLQPGDEANGGVYGHTEMGSQKCTQESAMRSDPEVFNHGNSSQGHDDVKLDDSVNILSQAAATQESVSDGCFFNDDVLKVNMSRLYNDNVYTTISQRTLKRNNYSENVPMLSDYGMMDPNVFLKMKICGQFNNGFIVAKLEGTELHTEEIQYSIYLIDPHAADEKTKFEQYNANVKIHKQPLVQPRRVDLSPFHQQVVLANIELLKENGFEAFLVPKTETSDEPKAGAQEPGIYLRSFPQLMGQILGEEDFVSFVHDLAQNGAPAPKDNKSNDARNFLWGSNTILPRPKRIWNILATRYFRVVVHDVECRACKNAVKLGEPLSVKQMEKIKRGLASLIHPWNCPHGRPTMKCLITTEQMKKIING
ncbi:DNA mismatch repair protein [Babesia ovata]|uniref:DNA mismatch repair protein n=1 Tax=Babesia ovata TaxID=189622 RepID=A0A2H6KHK9_9APIC|nr:DNA mismatch repair protein [Babesia ovata]GBE62461.1 DNA mismatch repair protein [Babesia ovata]